VELSGLQNFELVLFLVL